MLPEKPKNQPSDDHGLLIGPEADTQVRRDARERARKLHGFNDAELDNLYGPDSRPENK